MINSSDDRIGLRLADNRVLSCVLSAVSVACRVLICVVKLEIVAIVSALFEGLADNARKRVDAALSFAVVSWICCCKVDVRLP